jgi:hypothetical protein
LEQINKAIFLSNLRFFKGSVEVTLQRTISKSSSKMGQHSTWAACKLRFLPLSTVSLARTSSKSAHKAFSPPRTNIKSLSNIWTALYVWAAWKFLRLLIDNLWTQWALQVCVFLQSWFLKVLYKWHSFIRYSSALLSYSKYI